MSLRLEKAIAAMQAVLEKRQMPRSEILGVQERLNADESDWCCVVITREHDDEWQLYLVWPDARCGEAISVPVTAAFPSRCPKCEGTLFVNSFSLTRAQRPGNCPLCEGTGNL